MITALMGTILALHLFTVDMCHQHFDNSLAVETAFETPTGGVYVHQEWNHEPHSV